MPTRRTARRRTSYGGRRRAQNVSYHKVITGSTRTLTSGTRVAAVDLLDNAEANTFYGKDLSIRGNSVVGLRGSWWFWTDAPLDPVQSMTWLSCGIISENEDVRAAITGDLNPIGPADIEGRYRPWHYRRTVPAIARNLFADGPVTSTFDQAEQAIMTRQGIGARRAEKFRSVRDTYSLYFQTDSEPEFDIVVGWQLQFYVRQP